MIELHINILSRLQKLMIFTGIFSFLGKIIHQKYNKKFNCLVVFKYLSFFGFALFLHFFLHFNNLNLKSILYLSFALVYFHYLCRPCQLYDQLKTLHFLGDKFDTFINILFCFGNGLVGHDWSDHLIHLSRGFQ